MSGAYPKPINEEKPPLVVLKTMFPPLSYMNRIFSRNNYTIESSNPFYGSVIDQNEILSELKYEDPEIIPYRDNIEVPNEKKVRSHQINTKPTNISEIESIKGITMNLILKIEDTVSSFGKKILGKKQSMLILVFVLLVIYLAYKSNCFLKDYFEKRRNELALINALEKSNL